MVEERASRDGLADAIAAADWTALLPAHRADGEDQPLGRPRCVAALPLADGLVLAVAEDERGDTYPVPLVLAGATVRRARPGDGAAEALVSALGTVRRGDGFEVTTWHAEPVSGERAVTVDQTNESVVVGERAVVKWTFLAGEGPHPAPATLAELERNGFAAMPRPWGAVQWRPAEGSAPRLLALVTGFVPEAVDGWTWAVDDVRRAATSGDAEVAVAAGGSAGGLTASFHRALAGTARPSTAGEAAARREDALAELERALSVTRGHAREVLDTHAPEVRAVLEAAPWGATPSMRVHGDLHVGQVLRSRETDPPAHVLTDFDGNPVLSPAERLAEQPAAQDVAGMAQSFTHAGLVVRRHHPALEGDAVLGMAAVARRAFLEAYRDGLGDQAGLWDERLLLPFALRQVCREFIYAATHLPRWSYVPEAALPMLVRGDRPREVS